MTDLLTLIMQGGPAIAAVVAIVVMIIFLKYLSEDRKDRAAERTQFLDCMLKFQQTTDLIINKCSK